MLARGPGAATSRLVELGASPRTRRRRVRRSASSRVIDERRSRRQHRARRHRARRRGIRRAHAAARRCSTSRTTPWPTPLAARGSVGGRHRRARTRDAAAPGAAAGAHLRARVIRSSALPDEDGRARRHAPVALPEPVEGWEHAPLAHCRRVARPRARRDPRGSSRRYPRLARRDPRRPRAPQARLRPRRAHEVRAGRARDLGRRAPRLQPRQPGRAAHRQHRVAEVAARS